MRLMSTTIAALAVVACLPAAAAIKTYSFNMDASQEVPANASPAAGSVFMLVDDTLDQISFAFTAFNLTGDAILAHIHAGMAGSSGAPVFDLLANADAAGPVVIGPVAIPFSFAAVGVDKSSSFADAINATPWGYYVNLHTTAYPGGEIRGQLAAVPEPATTALLLAGLALIGTQARRRRS